MTVYIEYVLINNFIIDLLLLKATFSLTGLVPSRGRLFLASFSGAILALAFPLVEGIKFIGVTVKVLSGFLITLIAHKYQTTRSYFINTAVFFAFTFLVGGGIIGVFNILGANANSELVVAIMCIPAYILLKILSEVVKYIYRRREIVGLTYDLEITVLDKSIKCKGFLDTGNGVYEGDNPVIVCSKRFLLSNLKEEFLRLKFRKITAFTVGGESENIVLSLKQIKIYIDEKPNIINNVTLMVAKSSVGEGYDIILHPALMERNNEDIDEVKKVS